MYDQYAIEQDILDELGPKKGNRILEKFWEVVCEDAEHPGYFAMSEHVGELQEEGSGDVELKLCRLELEFENGINAGSVITSYDVCALGDDKVSQLKFKLYEAVRSMRSAWRSVYNKSLHTTKDALHNFS